MKSTSKMNLIQKAQKVKTSTYSYNKKYTFEEVQLANAWVHRAVTSHQLATVLNMSGGNIYVFICGALKYGASKGWLETNIIY
ncbi:MAG TPA: hypothetical protein PKU78_03390 [Candidatus Dojkabacteria bacterium]|nr:hypothetical protein [Candidatus Dojkabacteria bacterium]HRO65239.1 hypothetical protein [Candidatus Dojkabacteria bacterium]